MDKADSDWQSRFRQCPLANLFMGFKLLPSEWSAGRRRLLTAGILVAWAVAAFYVEENLRGSRMLDHATTSAKAERIPLLPAAVFPLPPPKDTNLFYSPVVQSRILWNSAGGASSPVFNPAFTADFPAPILWGDIHPHSTSLASRREPATTDSRTGRSLNFQATREAMEKLGWAVPKGESPAHDVRTCLDRYQNELAEWSSEIRGRPAWVPAPVYFGSIKAFEKLFFSTVRLFALRAVAGSASKRPSSEILADLESAILLSRHIWYGAPPVNAAIWETLRARRLNDSELMTLGSQLPDYPLTKVLLERTWMESLPWITEILSPLGRDTSHNVFCYYWNAYTLADLNYEKPPTLRWLKPAGWYALEEAAMIEMMIENQRWLRQIDNNWNSPAPLPITPNKIAPPRIAAGNIRYMDDLGFHLHACGCPVGAIVSQAVEARVAMVAIGLERHRLEHGTWPASLAEAAALIPGGLRNNPQTHQPISYELLSDGGWKLNDADSGIVWLMPGSP